jgi:hypothetical protein
MLLVASDVTEQRAAEQARCEAAIAQREVLVAKCTTASRTTCRAWPACCSRRGSAGPRWPR